MGARVDFPGVATTVQALRCAVLTFRSAMRICAAYPSLLEGVSEVATSSGSSFKVLGIPRRWAVCAGGEGSAEGTAASKRVGPSVVLGI